VTAGNALEFYDFVTYTFFATQIGHALFPGDASSKLLLSLATFGVGFLTRPLGGFVIGRMADRRGRKPAMILSFTMMGVAMTGLALTPSTRSAPRRDCVELGSSPGATPSLELAPGETAVLESDQAAAVKVGRFAGTPSAAVGTLQPDEAMALTFPAEGIPDPWHVSSVAPTRACLGG